MNIMELNQKRQDAVDAAKLFVASHRNEHGVLSDEDNAIWEKMDKEIQDYSREIKRMTREAQMDEELKAPVNQPLVLKPATASMDGAEKPKSFRAKAEYKQAMLDALRSNFTRISNVLQEGVDADGGYLVPEEYDNRLIEKLEQENIMRSLGHVLTTSGPHKINIASTKPAAAWIEEGGTLEFKDAKFDQILLDAHKLYVAVKVTEELLYDSAFDLESYLMTSFAKALANAEEDAFLNGTGTGQPLGLFADKGGGEVFKKLTAEIKADDVLDLTYGLKRPYRKNAAFIMNDATIATIRKFKDGNGNFMWQPSYQVGEPDTLLGYPIHTSAFAPEDKIAFGDFSYYNIGDRGTRSFAQLRELFAGNGMIGFVAKERVDGKLILPEAVKILQFKGTTPAAR